MTLTQTTVTSRFVCMGMMGYESRSMFHKSYLSIKATKIHVNRHSPMCKAAGLGYRELRVESRRSDVMDLVRLGLRLMFGTNHLVFLGYPIYLL